MGEPELTLLAGVSQAPRAEWNALVGDESPFLEWEWLASLEEAGVLGPRSGWAARPMVAREDGRLVAACPLYVKGHSEGEFVFDWAWADAAYRAGIEYYPKLLAGIPFTPVAGARFLTAPGADRALWIRRLAAALRALCTSSGLSGVHVNFCREDELRALEGEGYLPRLGLQYHWHNRGYLSFEGYLAELRSKRRNQTRREMREVGSAGVRIEALTGSEIPDALFPVLFRFYRETVDRRVWGRRYLNRRFFDLLAQRFRHRLCFVVARLDGEPIAGTFNVWKGGALYGRYWGATRAIRHLHFNVCYYAAIDYCIRSGLERFEPGAGGDYKQLRGFDPQPTRSAHFLADERLAAGVARYLDGEREETDAAIAEIRGQSALKPAAS